MPTCFDTCRITLRNNLNDISLKPTKELGSNIAKIDPSLFEPKDIIRNGPATIVFWKDGTKTVVKLKEGTPDDQYSAFCIALAKKIFGSGNRVNKIAKKARLELNY